MDFYFQNDTVRDIAEETVCAECEKPLETGDKTVDLYQGGLEDADMVERCCSKDCASAYAEKLHYKGLLGDT